jgi:hypothetical protein
MRRGRPILPAAIRVAPQLARDRRRRIVDWRLAGDASVAKVIANPLVTFGCCPVEKKLTSAPSKSHPTEW